LTLFGGFGTLIGVLGVLHKKHWHCRWRWWLFKSEVKGAPKSAKFFRIWQWFCMKEKMHKHREWSATNGQKKHVRKNDKHHSRSQRSTKQTWVATLPEQKQDISSSWAMQNKPKNNVANVRLNPLWFFTDSILMEFTICRLNLEIWATCSKQGVWQERRSMRTKQQKHSKKDHSDTITRWLRRCHCNRRNACQKKQRMICSQQGTHQMQGMRWTAESRWARLARNWKISDFQASLTFDGTINTCCCLHFVKWLSTDVGVNCIVRILCAQVFAAPKVCCWIKLLSLCLARSQVTKCVEADILQKSPHGWMFSCCWNRVKMWFNSSNHNIICWGVKQTPLQGSVHCA